MFLVNPSLLGSILECIAGLLACLVVMGIITIVSAMLLTLLMLMCWAMIVFWIIQPILYVKYILMGQHKGERRIVSKKKADGLFETLEEDICFILEFYFVSSISSYIPKIF